MSKSSRTKSKTHGENIDYRGLFELFKEPSQPTRKSTRKITQRVLNPDIETNKIDSIINKHIDLELKETKYKKCELLLMYIRYLESIDEIQNTLNTYSKGGTHTSTSKSVTSGFDCLKELPEIIYAKYREFINKLKRKTIIDLKNEIADLIIERDRLLVELQEKEIKKEKPSIPKTNTYPKRRKTMKIRKNPVKSAPTTLSQYP
jgi:hypothetical protein